MVVSVSPTTKTVVASCCSTSCSNVCLVEKVVVAPVFNSLPAKKLISSFLTSILVRALIGNRLSLLWTYTPQIFRATFESLDLLEIFRTTVDSISRDAPSCWAKFHIHMSRVIDVVSNSNVSFYLSKVISYKYINTGFAKSGYDKAYSVIISEFKKMFKRIGSARPRPITNE